MPIFEELSDLAQFVKPNKIKDLVIVGTTSNPTTKLDQLYHGLTHGHFADDAMAAEQVLGCSARDAAYYKLKGRLYEKLMNTLFFIDVNQPHFTHHQKAYHSCLRQLLAVKALLARGARIAAVPIAQKGIKKSQKFEFTEISLAFAKHLRTHYGTVMGDRKSFKKYNSMVNKYIGTYLAELKAEEYYNELMVNYVNSNATKKEIYSISEKFSSELKELLKEHESFQLYFVAYLVFILRYEIVNDHINILKIGQEALKYFNTKRHLASQSALFHYSFKMTAAYIQLQDYPKAQEMANNTLQYVPEGVANWFFALDYYILLYLHSKDYQSAYDTYQKAIKHPAYIGQTMPPISEQTVPPVSDERVPVISAQRVPLHCVIKNELARFLSGIMVIASLTMLSSFMEYQNYFSNGQSKNSTDGFTATCTAQSKRA